MVNQDVVEDSGHSTQLAAVNKKHCHFYLFDRLPQTLKNSAAVQEYLAVELGLRRSYILVGSRSKQSFAEIVKNEKTKRSQECFAELIVEPNGHSFASQKCTGGEKT